MLFAYRLVKLIVPNFGRGAQPPFVLDRAADAVEALLTDGLTTAQNKFHGDSQANSSA